MPLEIELKAWVEAPGNAGSSPETCPAVERLKARLSALGTYGGAYDKKDTYWRKEAPLPPFPPAEGGAAPPLSVRIRREFESPDDKTGHRRILVTYKARELYDGVEVNDEREFEIKPEAAESGVSGPGDEAPAPGAFEDLLRRFGLGPAVHKRKRGWAWDCGGIRAELSRVDNLGWFIELEIIRQREELAGAGGAVTAVTIEECRNRLLSLLDRLEIPRSGIESRPYTAMVAEKSTVMARSSSAGSSPASPRSIQRADGMDAK